VSPAAPPELAALRDRLAEVHHLGAAVAVLWWDQNVCMPPAGAPARAEALGALERIAHERLTAPEVARALAALESYRDGLDPDSDEARYLARAQRDHEKAARVPADLAAAMAREGALGEQAWLEARAADDFELLRDSLERQVELRRRYAACFPEAAHPYDVLLDDFEEGATIAALRPLLDELQHGLRPLVKAAGRPGEGVWNRPVPRERQERLVHDVLAGIGFDAARFRLDVSPHPFSQSPALGDHRITTRYREDDLTWALHSALHEFGHALYEAQLDPALGPGPLAHAVSLGVHESQSRLWENQVGRSRPFCAWLLERLQTNCDGFGDLTADDLFAALQGVRPSLVRTEADETTYNLHVVLRVGLEVALLEGSLEVAELPGAWDDGMESLLGVRPQSPREGVLQDIHWPAGLMGYFATYTLGNLMAAQLWERAQADLPDLEAGFAAGEFAPLREWLREHIHRHGRRHTPRELLERATGDGLRVEPLLAYLEGRLLAAGSIPAAA
jgi:carboxypeptidase Taq